MTNSSRYTVRLRKRGHTACDRLTLQLQATTGVTGQTTANEVMSTTVQVIKFARVEATP